MRYRTGRIIVGGFHLLPLTRLQDPPVLLLRRHQQSEANYPDLRRRRRRYEKSSLRLCGVQMSIFHEVALEETRV